jgi:carbon storage regulator
MLVLSRKIGEKILIGDDITITVVQLRGNRVRIGVEAPSSAAIKRQEIVQKESSPLQTAPAEQALAGSGCCWGKVALPS